MRRWGCLGVRVVLSDCLAFLLLELMKLVMQTVVSTVAAHVARRVLLMSCHLCFSRRLG